MADLVPLAPGDGPQLLRCAVLGAWENLCGPCVKWRFGSAERALDAESARGLVKVCLSFHLKDPPRRAYFSAADFGDLGACGFSCVYSAPALSGGGGGGQETSFCLLGLFPRAFFPRLRQLTPALAAFWEWRAALLRADHWAGAAQVAGRVAAALDELQALLGRLERPPAPPEAPAPAPRLGRFLARAVAALLMAGRALVVGGRAAPVNLVVRLLALFLPPARRRLCALAEPGDRFHAALAVQGLLWRPGPGPGARAPVSAADLLEAPLPLAVVNVDRNEVLASAGVLAHRRRRRAFLARAIAARLDADADDDPGLGAEELLADAAAACPLVDRLCRDLDGLEPARLHAAVGLFMRQLAARAHALAALVAAADAAPAALPRRQLWATLGVAAEGDLLVLQAVAEQLRPGTAAALDRVCSDAHV